MVTKYNTSDIVYAPVEIISARGSDNGEIYYEVKLHGYSDKYIIAESEIRPENQVNVYYQPETELFESYCRNNNLVVFSQELWDRLQQELMDLKEKTVTILRDLT